MIFKNLFRRKGRTILTLVGISIGVAAIVALGAVSRGLRAGFSAMTRGSQADLVLTQTGAMSVITSSMDETIADELRTWPEVAAVDGVLLSNALIENASYLFIFGYDPQGFAIEHFRVVEGEELADVRGVRGKPLLLGKRAAERLSKKVGDTLRVTGSTFRIVGIYETGDGFEDGGAVVALPEAQALALQPRRVSMLYVKLRSPSDADRFKARVERRFSDLSISTTTGFADQEQILALLEGMAMGVAGLAVIIGGVVMTNTLWMSVFERTREIGLLRALGWRRRQVLFLILGESLTLALLGGLAGIGLGVASVFLISRASSWLGAFGTQFSPDLFTRALVTVFVLGLVGGAYPAWWASRLLPLEALQYEGGRGGHFSRYLPGGMVVRNLWRRRLRTVLTLLGIGISIAAIVALGGLAYGMLDTFTAIVRGSEADLFAAEADIDSDFSAIDERVGSRIAARPDVKAVSGMIMTGVNTEKMPMLLVFGYHPREPAIRRFRIIEGEPLTSRHQVIVGRRAAEQMGLKVGDTLRLLDSNFRVVGIFETGVGWEDIGVVISLREAQALTGKPRQVQFYAIGLRDPRQAEAVRDELEALFPEIDFALTSELAESMSDFRVMQEMVDQISFLAVFIGALGMLNTMLMSVLERTREIGVLRALGWSRRRVLGLILQEALVLGVIGGICGAILGVSLGEMLGLVQGTFGAIEPIYSPQIFVQAIVVAMIAGAVGGLYPAWRATRMRPVEALRYE
ncbi:MAG: ABC transporter permease [Anaerolineae bacterium]|nr:ABC transporter permease [Anaerolineae bacterium]